MEPHAWRGERVLLGFASVAAVLLLYGLLSSAHRVVDPSALPGPVGRVLRPQVLPPLERLADTLVRLAGVGLAEEDGAHAHSHDHAGELRRAGLTLQGSLLVSARRVIAGLALGAPLGLCLGLAMGWSRRVDDYLHPVFILVRAVPPVAIITYAMLWLGHGEAHLLLPVAYAVFAPVAIPAYHGVRDLSEVYLRAARALGARRGLLLARVVLPGAGPQLLAGLRYALIMAWMTAVGAEMLMADEGVGALLVGGGLWSSRLEVRVDPAVVIVGILGLAAAGYAMDLAARLLEARLTRWARR
jgi:ABC-type nitrate/sulfonate/bicarbonate transport system permease component